VRRDSYSSLTTCNRVELQQDAAEFYANLIRNFKAAWRSIHHRYFIWRSDEFTERLKGAVKGSGARQAPGPDAVECSVS
jgi:phosphatidylserine/phosphatidylglycerophosphate/cardiolipin synthase-like enzyme